MTRALFLAIGAAAAFAARASAQTPAHRDSIAYGELLTAATSADPRQQ
jgi:hypothetical protein